MWDKKKHFSKAEYIAMIRKRVEETLYGGLSPTVGGVYYRPLWWLKREINVCWEPGITTETVQIVCEEIDALSYELGIGGFSFKKLGQEKTAMRQISRSMCPGGLDEKILIHKFVVKCLEDKSLNLGTRGGIYITRRPFLNDHVSWGVARFSYGLLALALYEDRQNNHEFLRGLVRHEATHLFGMTCHCDDFQNVEGYKYTQSCNMHYEIPSSKLCLKCTDMILTWWKRLNEIEAEAKAEASRPLSS